MAQPTGFRHGSKLINRARPQSPFGHETHMAEFIFATGIENSYPMTVVRDENGNMVPLRRDQMRETQHYDRWEEDFALVNQLGIKYLRYGPPYYLIQAPSGECNFSLSPEQLGAT